MGYIHCDGKKYGIVPKRNIIDSIILHLPLINLIYSKKICVHITNRLKSGAPTHGIYADIRIFKNQKQLNIKFMVPDAFNNAILTIENNDWYKEFGKDKIYCSGIEYHTSIVIQKSE